MSTFLDVRTVFIVNSILMTMISITMLYIASTQKTYPGFKYWTAAIFISGAAYFLLGLRHLIPSFFSVTIANISLMLCWLIIKKGLETFFAFKSKPFLEYCIFSTLLILFLYFAYIDIDVKSRIIIIALYLAYISTSLAIITYKGTYRLFGTFNFMLISTQVGLAVLSLITVIIHLWHSQEIASLTNPGSTYILLITLTSTLSSVFYINLITLNSLKLTMDLKASQKEVNQLTGLLPICSKCKKIRDDQGYWNQVETYIEKYSEAKFSHGLCGECADELYGEEPWYKKSKKREK